MVQREDDIQDENIKEDSAEIRREIIAKIFSIVGSVNFLKRDSLSIYPENITERYRQCILSILKCMETAQTELGIVESTADRVSNDQKLHYKIGQLTSLELAQFDRAQLQNLDVTLSELSHGIEEAGALMDRAFALHMDADDEKIHQLWQERIEGKINDHNHRKNKSGEVVFVIDNKELFSIKPMEIDLSDYQDFENLRYARDRDSLGSSYTDHPVFDEVVYAIDENGEFNILNVIRDDDEKVIKIFVVIDTFDDKPITFEELKRSIMRSSLMETRFGGWLGPKWLQRMVEVMLKVGYIPPEQARQETSRVREERAETIAHALDDDE